MDRKQLEGKLELFKDECANRGKPIEGICLEEAYPGDASTSYILKVKAKWIDGMSCSKALDFLLDVLWDKVDVKVRESIFSVYVLTSDDELHCNRDIIEPKERA
jgi:hypothetical protein